MTWSRHSSLSRWHADRWLPLPLGALTLAVTALVAFIVLFLLREAAPVMAHLSWADVWPGARNASGWHPLDGEYGMSALLWATVLVSIGALLLAAPLGLGCAVFMQFMAPAAWQRALRLVMGLLAGTPSVVFGLWGLTMLVPWIAASHPPGASLIAAVLVLALMVLPTVALTSASALSALPGSLREGSLALGMGLRSHVVSIALPAARQGIGSGMVLALARALGETMAVLMVAGNVVAMPSSWFDPVRVLTANIALEMAYATGLHRSALFASGMLLALLVLSLALAAAWARSRPRHG